MSPIPDRPSRTKRSLFWSTTWVSPLTPETALLTERVEKDHMLIFKREFILTATTLRLIISRNGEQYRNFGLADLKGVSISVHEDVGEMVLHVAMGGDEHLYSQRVAEVIDTLKSIYAGQLKKNLPVFAIDARSLSAYVTSERDAAMGISKMPLRRFRLREGRIFDNGDSSDEEDYEREMQNAFKLLNEREQER